MTLISLPSGPLLKIVCMAARKELTGAWLSLVSMLVIQLDPPSLLPSRFKTTSEEAQMVISQLLPELLQDSLVYLGRPGVMEDVSRHSSLRLYALTVDLESRHSARIFFLYGVGKRPIVAYLLRLFICDASLRTILFLPSIACLQSSSTH